MNPDAATVKAYLAQNIEAFLGSFAPEARADKKDFVLGDAAGAPGKSLRICAEGRKAGQWVNNNTGDPAPHSGSLLDLYMGLKGCDFRTALQECTQWLRDRGVLRDGAGFQRLSGKVQEARKPQGDKAPVSLKPKKDWLPLADASSAMKYLAEYREIPPEIAKTGAGEGEFWFPEAEEKLGSKTVPGLAFPGYSPDGKTLLIVKYLALERYKGGDGDSKKLVRSNKGANQSVHLIGMDQCDPSQRRLYICAGEIDMLTARACGVQAVSPPFGEATPSETTGADHKNDWIDNDWEWLQQWEEIAVVYDNDEQGRAAQKHVGTRLGSHRTLYPQWNEEDDDLNMVWLRDREECEDILKGVRPEDPEKLARARDFATEIWEEFFPPKDAPVGWETPWTLPFRFQPGELTVWQGYNGHGKTIMQSHCAVHLASLGSKALVVSLEMRARKTLRNMMRQLIAASKPISWDERGNIAPDHDLFNRAMDWLDERIFVFNHRGRARVDAILEIARYVVRRYGVEQIFIDSLMMLGLGADDYSGQKEVMNILADFVSEFPHCHLHLVAHSKKPPEKKNELTPPDKYTIKGDSSVPDIAHNVVCTFRNYKKEMEIIKLKNQRGGDKDEIENEIDTIQKTLADAQLLVQKCREEGVFGIKNLFFDREGSWQYLENYHDQPKRYLEI